MTAMSDPISRNASSVMPRLRIAYLATRSSAAASSETCPMALLHAECSNPRTQFPQVFLFESQHEWS